MQYFAKSLYKKLNHRVAPLRSWYRLKWDRNVRAYQRDLSRLLRVAPEGVKRFGASPLHDARFLRFEEMGGIVEIVMDCSETPLAPSSRATLRFQNARLLQRPTVGDWWLYEELTRGSEREYCSEVLCRDGSFGVEFDDAEIVW